MIVCHCNRVQSSLIEASAKGIAGQGACEPPTPEEVYALLGVQPCCRGCFPLATRIISDSLASLAGHCPGTLADSAVMAPAE
jgi:bacterioferritin-associated ferredoxin